VTETPRIRWVADGQECEALWRSAAAPPPRTVRVADDTLSADAAYRLACEGTALLWHGDFQNARQLLAALARRAERKRGRGSRTPSMGSDEAARPMAERFHLHRQAQAQRARTLSMLLIPLDADYTIPLRRAPDLRLACSEAWGDADPQFGVSVVSLRELLGLIGAHEWRKKGVAIPALGGRIHPHYGVFSPVRGEYVDLVAQAPLPDALAKDSRAFDIGTGTGVLALMLARRGVARVIATERDPRALTCARDNVARFGRETQVEVREADLFPEGRAALVVCNPPWVPARPSSPVEHAVYDPESRMLRGFLAGLTAHLCAGGEGWLILSNLAEHLGLRSRDELTAMFEAAELEVLARHDIRPRHGKVLDRDDALHAARSAEVTSLWRLAAR